MEGLLEENQASEMKMRELELEVRKARPTKRNRTMVHVARKKAKLAALRKFNDQENQCENEKCPGGTHVLDAVRSAIICTRCGMSSQIFSKEAYDPMNIVRAKSKSAVYSRKTYVGELIRQWLLQEPPIQFAPRQRLRKAYAEWVSQQPNGDRALEKDDVKDIIDAAHLSRKRFLEKWRNIRVLVQGEKFPWPPRPDNDTVAAIEDVFHRVIGIWNVNYKLREKAGRNSIISTYYIFRRILLMMNRAVFDMWSPEFPVPDSELYSKRLFGIWTEISRCGGWSVRVLTTRHTPPKLSLKGPMQKVENAAGL